MRDAWKRGLRVAGYAIMALAIAHCGDNSNNSNDNGGTPKPTKTAAPGKTSTPASTPIFTPGTSPSTSTSEVTATATPSGGSGVCPAAIAVAGDAQNARLHSAWTCLAHGSKIIDRGEATVSTDCGGKPRPCGVCNLTGPIANPDNNQGVSNNRRCTNNTSIECTDDTACSARTCIGGTKDGQACTG